MKVKERPLEFSRRRFCNLSCVGRFRKGGPASADAPPLMSADEWAAKPIEIRWPGAAFQTANEAPVRCTKPGCGGLLRDETVALACINCGSRLYIESWLRAWVSEHGFGTPDPEVLGSRQAAVQWGRRWNSAGTEEA